MNLQNNNKEVKQDKSVHPIKRNEERRTLATYEEWQIGPPEEYPVFQWGITDINA